MRWLWVASPLVLLHIDAVCCCAHRSLLLLNTRYVNHAYCQPPPEVLGPVAATPGGPRRRVWAQGLVLMPSASLRHLQLWSDYYLRWDRTVERVRWQLSSLSGWAAQASRRDALQDMLDNVETAPAQPSDGISRKKYVLVTLRRCVAAMLFVWVCEGYRRIALTLMVPAGGRLHLLAVAARQAAGRRTLLQRALTVMPRLAFSGAASCARAVVARSARPAARCSGASPLTLAKMPRTAYVLQRSARWPATRSLAAPLMVCHVCGCVCGRGEAGCCPTAIGSCVSQLRRTHRPVQPGPPVDTVEICDGGCAER